MTRFRAFIGAHVFASAIVAAAFAWRFGHNWRDVLAHVLLLAEWDLLLVVLLRTAVALASRVTTTANVRWPRLTYACLMTATCTLQVYLYTLNVVSNVSWGRNITGHLVIAFAPTVWFGKETFPVGPAGITAFAGGTLL